jgi:flavin reductase (DIM6/NTAB) family NADH-FMN oxidoreductase RutF
LLIGRETQGTAPKGRFQANRETLWSNAVASDVVDAPYVKVFPVVIKCQILHTIKIGLHPQFIGETLDIKIEEAVLGPEDHPDVEKLGLFVLLDGYRGIGAYLGQAFSIGKEM